MPLILSHLDTRDLACLAATCPSLWRDVPTPSTPPRIIGPVETELRLRAERRGLVVGSLPEGAPSWLLYLLACDRRDALRRHAPLAVGFTQSIFVDREGRLLSCGGAVNGQLLLGHAVDPEADPDAPRKIVSPTPVPSMQATRVVSVATGGFHCLALSTVGEVYSWGSGDHSELGHLDQDVMPNRIVSLSRIERIAAATSRTSAAVDVNGHLYTWGRPPVGGLPSVGLLDTDDERLGPNGLGYEVDIHETWVQPIPRRVDALLQHRVVGVALGHGFTLAVTDAGAVFSFGYNEDGALGHGSSVSEVLPRQIEALTQTGRRFVAVAAADCQALALTEEGELYGWGEPQTAEEPLQRVRVPQRIAELVGIQVKLVYALDASSCAVTETGELFSWSHESDYTNHLGHGVGALQLGPKRVEGLGGVKIAAAAICHTHTLVADEDGVVWGFGKRCALGLDDEPGRADDERVEPPTLIPALRVRAGKSPPVVWSSAGRPGASGV